ACAVADVADHCVETVRGVICRRCRSRGCGRIVIVAQLAAIAADGEGQAIDAVSQPGLGVHGLRAGRVLVAAAVHPRDGVAGAIDLATAVQTPVGRSAEVETVDHDVLHVTVTIEVLNERYPGQVRRPE